jgi:SMC interacting uncharacterized protein involved in chromosome segregation
MNETEKERLKKTINESIDAVNEKIEDLKSRREELGDQMQLELDKRIRELEEQRRSLLSRSSEFGHAAGEAARSLGDGLKGALKELEQGVSSAWKEFNRK